MFKSHLYLKISRNSITLRHVQSRRETARSAEPGFTSERLLVGNFSAAERLVAPMVKELTPRRFFAPAPCMLIHPLVMVEGGLSEVEQRIFTELGYSAGARKVKIHLGRELDDDAVISCLQ